MTAEAGSANETLRGGRNLEDLMMIEHRPAMVRLSVAQRRSPSLAVAVAIAALAIAACSSAASDSDQPSTTPAPTEGLQVPATARPTEGAAADTEDRAHDAIAAVTAAIDAKNRGDLDGWLSAFQGGTRPGVPLYAEQIRLNAGEQLEITSPCQASETDASETAVGCVIRFSDAYFTVGGIIDERPLVFTVNANAMITAATGFSLEARDRFNEAFHLWLEEAYPAVFEGMNPGPALGTWPGFTMQDPSQMLIALDYVEEFVARSDTYPLEPEEAG